jgi:hypothetical protein
MDGDFSRMGNSSSAQELEVRRYGKIVVLIQDIAMVL